MKKKSAALAIVIVALFGSVAFAAVPHYWGSSDQQTASVTKSSDHDGQNGSPAKNEYGHGHRNND